MTPAQRVRRAELLRAVEAAKKDVAFGKERLSVAREMLKSHDAWVRKFEKEISGAAVKFKPIQCARCPFRKTSAPGWLGGYDVGSIFRAIWHGVPFFCHTAVGGKDGRGYEKPDWRERAMKNGKLCVGGLAFANKMPAPPSEHLQIRRARERVKEVEVECMAPKEFGEHHDSFLKKGAAK